MPVSIVLPIDTPDELLTNLTTTFGSRNFTYDDDYVLDGEFVMILHILNHTEKQIMDELAKHIMLYNVLKVIR